MSKPKQVGPTGIRNCSKWVSVRHYEKLTSKKLVPGASIAKLDLSWRHISMGGRQWLEIASCREKRQTWCARQWDVNVCSIVIFNYRFIIMERVHQLGAQAQWDISLGVIFK